MATATAHDGEAAHTSSRRGRVGARLAQLSRPPRRAALRRAQIDVKTSQGCRGRLRAQTRCYAANSPLLETISVGPGALRTMVTLRAPAARRHRHVAGRDIQMLHRGRSAELPAACPPVRICAPPPGGGATLVKEIMRSADFLGVY